LLTPLISKKTVKPPLKQALLCFVLVFSMLPAIAQVKNSTSAHQFKDFNKDLTEANLTFTLPNGFKEAKPIIGEDPSFDYGIEMPGADFEIWFQVKSLKAKNEKIANPDSLYAEMGRAEAAALIGEKNYLTRNIPTYELSRYNADVGKTYVLNLPDSPTTKHYKYAMVVALQKNHTGTVLAVCFANELGPGFFKNVNTASSCIKFNPQ
jgi:hypothetical protein